MLTTVNGRAVLRPEEVDQLLVRPALAASIAAAVSRVVPTSSTEFRIPIVVEDPAASYVAEGAEIPIDDIVVNELVVVPSKIAALTTMSREQADDSSPSSAQFVGERIAQDIARKLDNEFFGALAPPAQSGLAALVGTSRISAGASWTDADPFAEAVAAVEIEGASVTTWVAHPTDALALAKIKSATGSKVPLLAADATEGARRVLEGRPLLVSPAVQAGVVWGIPQDRVVIVIRDDSRIDVSTDVLFTKDSVAVRGTARIGIGFPHPAAIARIALTGAPAAP